MLAGYSVSVVGLTSDDDVGWERAEDGYFIRRVHPEDEFYEIKKALSRTVPLCYRYMRWQYRWLRSILERRSPVALKPGSELSPRNGVQRTHHSYMMARLQNHKTVSRVMARTVIATCPRVVHAHDLDTLLAAIWAARVTGAAVVFDSHEIWWHQHAEGVVPDEWNEFFRLLQERLIHSADYVITVCESIAEYFAELHGIEKPSVVRNSTELPLGGDNRPLSERPDDEPVEVLFHGGFWANRGLEELIEAAKRFEGVHLTLRGFGTLEKALKEAVEQAGLENVVSFEGPVPIDRVVDAASNTDIGVIPYKPVCLNNRYSTPNKLFEYMAAGIAVAASDLPEIGRIVRSEGIGVLFNPCDPTSIANAINYLAADRRRLRAMKARSKQAALERHNWQVDDRRLIEVYRELLPRHITSCLRRMVSGRPAWRPRCITWDWLF